MSDVAAEPKKPSTTTTDQQDSAWKTLWATKTILPETLGPQLHDLVVGAMNNGYGWLTLSGSVATCVAVANWAKTQGFAAYIAEAKEPSLSADAVLEEMPMRHAALVKIAWITMLK